MQHTKTAARIFIITGVALGLSAFKLTVIGGDEYEKPAEPELESFDDGPEFTSEPPSAAPATTFYWSQPIGTLPSPYPKKQPIPPEPNFRVCVVYPPGSRPSSSNRCYDFDRTTCTISNPGTFHARRNCSGQFTLPRILAGVESDWYVRAEHPKDHKTYSNSNTMTFSWLAPSLRITSTNLYLLGTLTAVADVENIGQQRASGVVVRFVYTITTSDGAEQMTVHDEVVQTTIFPGTTEFVSAQEPAPLRALWPFIVRVDFEVDPDDRIIEIAEYDNHALPEIKTFQP